MSLNDTLIFVDGENLVLRYQEMLRSGRKPTPDNIHIKDCFVWNQRVLEDHLWNLKRIAYYTSVTGDDIRVREVREQIAQTTFQCRTDVVSVGASNVFRTRTGQIVPFVRKKPAKSRKESICDIAIAVDVMRACYRNHANNIWLFTGDGDFLSLISEIVHSGKSVYASAFSSGLNEEIRFAVDEFLPLDKYFFLEESNPVVDDQTEDQKPVARALTPDDPR